jgi:hypothetical protein
MTYQVVCMLATALCQTGEFSSMTAVHHLQQDSKTWEQQRQGEEQKVDAGGPKRILLNHILHHDAESVVTTSKIERKSTVLHPAQICQAGQG